MLSFKRVPQDKANCGSVVLLTTDLGDFTLDDTHLYHADWAAQVTGSFTVEDDHSGSNPERRLSARHGRRLADQASGLFNFIDESEFTCSKEWKGEFEANIMKPPKAP